MKTFAELSEREVLTLAITGEEEDSRIYQSFADSLRETYPHSAAMFDEMAAEERGHRDMLYHLYREKFGEHLPPIRREDVKGFLKRRPIWLTQNLPVDKMRKEAEIMELQAARFYEKAATQTLDVNVRQLLTTLAEAERGHERRAGELEEKHLKGDAEAEEAHTKRRMFVLQYVQPGLAGLMDGSVSTLAPLFAAAFATHSNWETFLVGLAASIGAGISMGFAEALSDDGSLTGRGAPWIRGFVCGLMTTVGGIGHTLPYLVPDAWPNAFMIATSIAAVIVLIELWAIAYVRARFMDTPFLQAAFQVVLGGVLVFVTGILIGSA
ncbi:rubrerythrin [Alsobacter soli]|uniref:Rubrerythrin n=1 Tax=Alsobacter soli TaxID=2109933 RepID=A0A2T1I068_9HYPH|nr:ferritin family protein [Alsobacter soli]PSC07099.1 rubrerythrin [Alsobacter soli]